MWDEQAKVLASDYRVIRYDTRGHDGRFVPPGSYDMEQLGNDVLAVLDSLHIEKAVFCGLSMGGHTGLWLGANAGHRFRGIMVCNSAAKIGTEAGWLERARLVRDGQALAMKELSESAPQRWFTTQFARENPAIVARAQAWMRGIDPFGYAACCEALAVSDLRPSLPQIRVPVLILAGDADPVTTLADARAMEASIKDSKLAVLSASHLSNLEAPEPFVRALQEFAGTLPH